MSHYKLRHCEAVERRGTGRFILCLSEGRPFRNRDGPCSGRGQGKWLRLMQGRKMKKAILKRTADALEKLAIGSMLVGLFQGHQVGIYIGLGRMAFSYILTVWEAKQ